MSQNRYYSSNAVSTTLTGGVSSGATTLPVAATTGFPVSLPFTLILERDTANEEVVTVTAVAGLNLTVTRGVDGTAAVSHSVGATVQHGVSARDFSEPQVHMAGSAGVHGLSGTVVGTTDAQTLTNKTLAAPTIIGAVTGTTGWSFDASGNIVAPNLPSGWTTYTPSWSAFGGTPIQPSLGNGSISGRYAISGGVGTGNRVITVVVTIVLGSTTNVGSGGQYYAISLPITPSDGSCGTWVNNGPNGNVAGICYFDGANWTIFGLYGQATLASGNSVRACMTYRG